MTTQVVGRRTAVEIVYEILSVCDNGGTNKTAIMYRSSLSYDQLRRYLSLLTTKELIRRIDGGRFQITPTGRRTLKRASTATRAIREMKKELQPAPVGS